MGTLSYIRAKFFKNLYALSSINFERSMNRVSVKHVTTCDRCSGQVCNVPVPSNAMPPPPTNSIFGSNRQSLLLYMYYCTLLSNATYVQDKHKCWPKAVCPLVNRSISRWLDGKIFSGGSYRVNDMKAIHLQLFFEWNASLSMNSLAKLDHSSLPDILRASASFSFDLEYKLHYENNCACGSFKLTTFW